MTDEVSYSSIKSRNQNILINLWARIVGLPGNTRNTSFWSPSKDNNVSRSSSHWLSEEFSGRVNPIPTYLMGVTPTYHYRMLTVSLLQIWKGARLSRMITEVFDSTIVSVCWRSWWEDPTCYCNIGWVFRKARTWWAPGQCRTTLTIRKSSWWAHYVS